MTTPDHIARAAEVLNQSVVRQSINDDISITVYVDGSEFEETLARALDAAGLLATPAHDAEVAAKALEVAASVLEGDTHIPDHKAGRSAIRFLLDRASDASEPDVTNPYEHTEPAP